MSYVPPTFSTSVFIEVDLVLWTIVITWVVLVPLCGVAALTPAWGAARKGIVDALGHA
jgi:ABC-type lipoprotein release transport system permease subunit